MRLLAFRKRLSKIKKTGEVKMSTFYEDNMNIKKINGFTLQQVSRDVWAIDEFGIDIMYLIIGTGKTMISSLSRYRKRLTTKCREIHFIKAETGQQSPRQCPDGNRHSDDGKPKDIGQRYRGKHGSGRTCYKVRGWSTGFS